MVQATHLSVRALPVDSANNESSTLKRIRNLFHSSLPARLMLVFTIAGSAILCLIFIILIEGFAIQWKVNVRPHLEQYLDYINQDIGNPPNVEIAEALAKRLPVDVYIKGPNVNYSSTGLPLDLEDVSFESRKKWRKNRPEAHKQLTQKETIEHSNLMFAEDDGRTIMRNQLDDFQVYFEINHAGNEEQSNKIRTWSVLCLLLILVLSFYQLRRMLRPVQDIKQGVKKMGAGQLDHRLPIRKENDLGELSGSINQMALDIEKMLDAKRQLLLAVSHELRSPLTRAKIASQMLDDSVNKVRLQEDIIEMESLISEILETERMNTPHAVLNKSQVDLASLVTSVIAELPENNTQLECVDDLPSFLLDEKRIRLLMRNTINNAICHSGDASEAPQVSLSYNSESITITVQDYGAGIAQEDLIHITEPFYRADPSRTRDTGGFGIGLYLCKLIVEAHKGELKISSKLGEGTVVVINLPL